MIKGYLNGRGDSRKDKLHTVESRSMKLDPCYVTANFPAFQSFQGANGQGSCSCAYNEKKSAIQEKNTNSRHRPSESILNGRTRMANTLPYSPSNWKRLLDLMEYTLKFSRTLADDPKNGWFRLSMTFFPRQSCRKFSNEPM
jgi:hypothetical protein